MARKELRIKATYSPEGVDPKVWDIDLLNDVRASEYIAMQRASGLPGMQAMFNGIDAADMVARKALLWLLLKRDMSTVPWDGLDFTFAEFDVEAVETDAAILSRLRELEAMGELTDEGRGHLSRLTSQMVEDPKA